MINDDNPFGEKNATARAVLTTLQLLVFAMAILLLELVVYESR